MQNTLVGEKTPFFVERNSTRGWGIAEIYMHGFDEIEALGNMINDSAHHLAWTGAADGDQVETGVLAKAGGVEACLIVVVEDVVDAAFVVDVKRPRWL